MKVIFGNKELELEGLTIDQYEKLQEMNMKVSDVDFISIITGLSPSDIRDATLTQIGFVSKMLNNYYNSSMEKGQLKPLIRYKDEVLGLTKPSTMSWGEFTDLEIITSQKPLNLRLLSSVLYRPCETFSLQDLSSKIVKYDYEECMERSKEMGDFKIQDIMSGLFFFTMFAKKLIDKEQDSMVQQKKTMESNPPMNEPLKRS
jgi:hypothetical protein